MRRHVVVEGDSERAAARVGQEGEERQSGGRCAGEQIQGTRAQPSFADQERESGEGEKQEDDRDRARVAGHVDRQDRSSNSIARPTGAAMNVQARAPHSQNTA